MGRYSGKGASAIKLTGKVGKEKQGVRLRGDLPGQDRRRQGLRRAAVGAAQGRLPARPDPRQRREEGTGGRGDGAGQEVRHHHAVHQLPDRAGCRRAGGAGPDAGRQAERVVRPERPDGAAGPDPRGERGHRQADLGGGVRQAEPAEAGRSGDQPRRLRPTASWRSPMPRARRTEAGGRPRRRRPPTRPPATTCARRTRRRCRPASSASICRCRPTTSATGAGWSRRRCRTSTAATAWRSAASGSTRASTPRCRP